MYRCIARVRRVLIAIVGSPVMVGLMIVVPFIMMASDKVAAQATVPYNQNLWRTGTTGPDVNNQSKRLDGNCADPLNTTCPQDPHWQLQRVYSDWFLNNNYATNYPGQVSMCQFYSLPPYGGTTINHSGIMVNEEVAGTAGKYPLYAFFGAGPAHPWVSSGSARWISQNYWGWHDGYGVGKPPGMLTAVPPYCHDPSAFNYPPNGGAFPNMGGFHTWVFRYTAPVSFSADVDLNSLQFQINGLVDNHIAVKVNGRPMNVTCGGRPTNHFYDLRNNSVLNVLYGQGDGGVANLPYCTPSLSFNSFENILVTNNGSSPFAYGANTIEIHVKSADTNIGLILNNISITGSQRIDNATCQILVPPTPVSVNGGSAYTVTIRAFNTGGTTWVPGTFNLASQQGQTNNHVTNGGSPFRVTASWGAGGNVPPGGFRDFTYTGTAPASGNFTTGWKMVHEGVAWFGTPCERTISAIPMVTIQGRVYNAFNSATGYNGLRINTCATTIPANVDTANGWSGNGHYEFSVPQDTNFCIQISGATLPAGTTARIKPFSEARSYAMCGSGGAPPAGNYCQRQTYECQDAGVNRGVLTCPGLGSGDWDRGVDGGYDIVLTLPPIITCNIGGGSLGVIVAGQPRPMVSTSVNIVPDANRPSARVNGTLSVIATGMTPTPATTNPYTNITTAATTVTYNNGPYTFNTTGNVTATGTPSGMYGTAAAADWWRMTAAVTPCTATGTAGVGPYLKVYGSDVWAGGGFAPSCTGTGGIIAFADNGAAGGNYRGASAQFGVSALMSINEFYSASVRSTNNVAPKGLTFANNTAAPYGGDFGGAGRCIANFWEDTRDPSLVSSSFDPDTDFIASAQPRQYLNPSTLRIATGTTRQVPIGAQIAIFVDGDVQISDNIEYQTGAGTIQQIPNLIIIARGNIRISSSVTRIDAVLVSQPCAAAGAGACNSRQFIGSGAATPGGVIYTCTDPDGRLFTNATLNAGCNSQLVINGGLVAQRVKFQRAFGRYNDGNVPAYEAPADFNNGIVVTSGNGPGEVINYTPEVYMARSPLKQPASSPDNTNVRLYDAAAGLPPIY